MRRKVAAFGPAMAGFAIPMAPVLVPAKDVDVRRGDIRINADVSLTFHPDAARESHACQQRPRGEHRRAYSCEFVYLHCSLTPDSTHAT